MTHTVAVTLSQKLEAQLQNARLGVFVPILLEIGVECHDDLEYVDDTDIEKRADISTIQKRRFFEFKVKAMGAGSAHSSSEPESQVGDLASQAIAQMQMPQFGSNNTASPSPNTTGTGYYPPPATTAQPALPMQTPRTRAMPLVEVLREVENLDLALQAEREKCAKLTEELELERENCKEIAEAKQAYEESHSRDIAMLEEMMQKVLNENDQLKAQVAAWEATKSGLAESQRAPEEQLVEMLQPRETSTLADRVSGGRTVEPMNIAGIDRSSVESNHASTGRYSIESKEPDGEPDMEPRVTLLVPVT